MLAGGHRAGSDVLDRIGRWFVPKGESRLVRCILHAAEYGRCGCDASRHVSSLCRYHGMMLSLALLEVDATSLKSGPRHPCPASALDPGPGVEVHTNPSQASRFLHAYLLIRVFNTCNSTLIGSVLLFSHLPVSFVILPTSSERRQYWGRSGPTRRLARLSPSQQGNPRHGK